MQYNSIIQIQKSIHYDTSEIQTVGMYVCGIFMIIRMGKVFFKWLLVRYGFQRRMTQLPPADREATVAKMTTHYNQGMQKSIL